jgi:hypothetical protein
MRELLPQKKMIASKKVLFAINDEESTSNCVSEKSYIRVFKRAHKKYKE